MIDSERIFDPPRVVAVIVAYNPIPGSLARLITTVQTQVAGVVLVCNSDIDVRELPDQSHDWLTVISNSTNLGLAAAQNIGLRQCVVEGADFAILLDQDSLPTADLLERLLAADSQLTTHGFAVGAVGPLLIDSDHDTPWPFLSAKWLHTRESTDADELGFCRCDWLYSSGSLVRLEHFTAVGLFMEPLFIDHVDVEWCYRASHHGLGFFGVPSIRMRHRMGDGHIRFLGRLHPRHSASRDYYVFRNSVILLGLDHIPIRWKLNELIRLVPRAIFYGLIGDRLVQHVSSCLRGIADGISYNAECKR